MLYYNKSWCQIHYLEDIHCVLLRWIGFSPSLQFRDACNASLELLKKMGAHKMIADNRKGRVVSPSDQTWMNEDWFPKAYKEGYRASAVIVSEDIFNQVSVTRIVNEMDEGKFYVQFFKEMEPAKEWLKELVI